MGKVLILDDDRELCALLVDYVRAAGMLVESAPSGEAGLGMLQSEKYDIVLLDVMMPGMSGFDVLAQIRRSSNVPVLMLTARGGEGDRIAGLEGGADDYVPKPCLPREIVARLRAILKRTRNAGAETGAAGHGSDLAVGDLGLRPAQHTASVRGVRVPLTNTEYVLLEMLVKSRGRPVSRQDLCREALGRPLERFDRSIDVHVHNIRQKLGPLPDGRPRIRAAIRKGYFYVVE